LGVVSRLRDSVELLPRGDDEQWGGVAARLGAVPGMLASWRTSLDAGLQRGLTAARRQALESAVQAERYADGAHDRLVAAYGEGPLAGRLAAAAEAAHAGYAETARYLRADYAPGASASDAVGAERYAVAARLCLGADVNPVEAYEWGWEELHRIEAELAHEAGRVHPGASVDEATALLGQTQYVVGHDAYRGWLQDRHDQAIQELHGTHFDIAAPLRVVEVTLEPDSTSGSAYYTPPSEDLTRPGRTWWPIGGRERFATWKELTIVFHEGVPGHHLEIGATRVAGERLSRFAKFSGVPGHGEGWALYAERLADELGWFNIPGSRLACSPTPRCALPAWSSTSASTSPYHCLTAPGGPSKQPASSWASAAAPNRIRFTPRWFATLAGQPKPSPTSSASGPGLPPVMRRNGGLAST
jgi:uncharacterized protein (DUF885 family)